MRILEVTAFSAGICGVGTRVLAESKLLAKRGHEVHIFSSNIFRGEGQKTAPSSDFVDGVRIHRFPTSHSFGQNTFFWNYEQEAMKLKPDVIITHAYRQYYSTKALKIARKLKIPCFLVTHAPFLEKRLRSWRLNLAVLLYDSLIGKKIINKYQKVIAITRWEIPHLRQLGVRKDKIIYIPNGIPKEFFKLRIINKKRKPKKLLFLGRIAPIKDIITLVNAMALLEKDFILDLIGPAEEEYKKELISLISKLRLGKRVLFHPAIYDLKKKIKAIDEHDIFILPSKREAMPQALIEAMARSKLVISSSTEGGKEIVQNGQNGFLFEIGNSAQLADQINSLLTNHRLAELRKNARKSVEKFSWAKLTGKIEQVYSS
jgi:glycosyltransferase involved in cell wall biosynthesis